jgi:DNA-binding MarR family transcriptional regulator
MTNLLVADREKIAHNGLLANMLAGEPKVTADANPIQLAVRAEKAQKLVRKQGELLTHQALQILLNVMIQPGITMQGLERPTGLNLSSVSRNLQALGEWHRLGRPGLNFVECVDDPAERRRKIAFLTKKGREFLSEYLSTLFGEDRYVESPTAREFLSKAYSARR